MRGSHQMGVRFSAIFLTPLLMKAVTQADYLVLQEVFDRPIIYDKNPSALRHIDIGLPTMPAGAGADHPD